MPSARDLLTLAGCYNRRVVGKHRATATEEAGLPVSITVTEGREKLQELEAAPSQVCLLNGTRARRLKLLPRTLAPCFRHCEAISATNSDLDYHILGQLSLDYMYALEWYY